MPNIRYLIGSIANAMSEVFISKITQFPNGVATAGFKLGCCTGKGSFAPMPLLSKHAKHSIARRPCDARVFKSQTAGAKVGGCRVIIGLVLPAVKIGLT